MEPEKHKSERTERLSSELVTTRDGDARGALWREYLGENPDAFSADLAAAAFLAADGDMDALVDQANLDVRADAKAAAAAVRGSVKR